MSLHKTFNNCFIRAVNFYIMALKVTEVCQIDIALACFARSDNLNHNIQNFVLSMQDLYIYYNKQQFFISPTNKYSVSAIDVRTCLFCHIFTCFILISLSLWRDCLMRAQNQKIQRYKFPRIINGKEINTNTHINFDAISCMQKSATA